MASGRDPNSSARKPTESVAMAAEIAPNESSAAQPNAQQHTKTLKIADRFILGRKINSGAFGRVYSVFDTKNNNTEYAAKIELRRKDAPQTIATDHAVMKAIKSLRQDALIPNVLHFGFVKDSYVLVMDLMGPSLEDLFTLLGKSFSVKTVMLIAICSLRALQTIHAANYLHRD